MKPFLKWVGGKQRSVSTIATLLPVDVRERHYHEPFLGSGALFFYLQPKRAHLNDINSHLITTFKAVRDRVGDVAVALDGLQGSAGNRIHYNLIKSAFNTTHLIGAARAAAFIYLNKTCFNGLYRTNKKGEFNVPVGRYKHPKIFDRNLLRECSKALHSATLTNLDYDKALDRAQSGDVVYMDPPYVPAACSSFTSYGAAGFSVDDHRKVASTFRALDAHGCLLALSNSDTPLVRELYAGYDIKPIQARHSVAGKGVGRGKAQELLIRNLNNYAK